MIALVVAALLVADAPQRRGFTLQLGLGLGATYRRSRQRLELRPGLAPLSLGIGAFVSPRLAVMARVAGTNYTEGADVRMSGFYGAVAQRWFGEAVTVSGGLGVGLFGIDDLKFYSRQDWSLFPDVGKDVQVGVSTTLRVGFAVARWRRHALQVSSEVLTTVLTNEPHLAVGHALEFGWQFF